MGSLLKMRESHVRVTWENPVPGARGPSAGSLCIQAGSGNHGRTPSPKPPGPPNVAASLAGSKQLPRVRVKPKSGLRQSRHSTAMAQLTAEEPRGRTGSLCPRTMGLAGVGGGVWGSVPSAQHLLPCVSRSSGPL